MEWVSRQCKMDIGFAEDWPCSGPYPPQSQGRQFWTNFLTPFEFVDRASGLQALQFGHPDCRPRLTLNSKPPWCQSCLILLSQTIFSTTVSCTNNKNYFLFIKVVKNVTVFDIRRKSFRNVSLSVCLLRQLNNWQTNKDCGIAKWSCLKVEHCQVSLNCFQYIFSIGHFYLIDRDHFSKNYELILSFELPLLLECIKCEVNF